MRLEFAPGTANEIRAAWAYYESRQQGLGDRFSGALAEALESISVLPRSASFINAQLPLRKKPLKKFPFIIIFEVLDEYVFVVSIHNTYKRPLFS